MVEEAIKKASILIEALSYIKKFRGTVTVIKYGGSMLEDSALRDKILDDIVFMNYVGLHPVIVHGAGPSISRALEQKGVNTKFVEGLRFTDKATLEVVIKQTDTMNSILTDELIKKDAEVESFNSKNVITGASLIKEELGLVGHPEALDIKHIKESLSSYKVPVVSPLGKDDAGNFYNINADLMATFIAECLKAEKLVLLTDVAGILKTMQDPDSLMSTLSIKDAQGLIEKGIITGGMLPKVQSSIEALGSGVNKVHIIDARIPHGLLLEIFTDKGIGTQIVH